MKLGESKETHCISVYRGGNLQLSTCSFKCVNEETVVYIPMGGHGTDVRTRMSRLILRKKKPTKIHFDYCNKQTDKPTDTPAKKLLRD